MIMVRFLTQSRNDAKSLMAPEEHPSLAQGGSPMALTLDFWISIPIHRSQ